MTTAIQKWGNSLALRIPSAVARQIRVENGDKVELRVESGALTIRAARPRYQLAKLLKKMKPSSGHGEVDWGKSVGREA
jgi:antitoxin MazE